MYNFFKIKKQETLSVDLEKSISEANYTVIDTELTGLNERKDSIISMGAVKMIGSKIDLSKNFNKLIKPEAKFKSESVVIHGITPSDVSELPAIDSILSEFAEFCGDDILIGHCVSIDMAFINREMRRVFGSPMLNPVIDTFFIYEWIRTQNPSKPCFSYVPKDSGLYEIAKCFEIPIRGAHDALTDAFITAQIFQRFIPALISIGIKNLGALLKIGHPEKGGDKNSKSGLICNF